ncbi:GNAT family N-acetyltransferase [Enterovirga sp. CN4-39]|uniref:GNAT family N-acetyltransferase n=1 Tax=Enterovirga sp. CN4-39 TaxID=3400910 RepID=UPI003C067038
MAVLASIVHPDYPEDFSVFAERLALFPQGCFALCDAGRLIGYALSHPWLFGEPPRLNSLLGELPERPTTLHVHDVALLPEARGSGAGSAIVARIAACAASAGLPNLSLVAVDGALSFWERHGFRVDDAAVPSADLSSYGEGARYMVRKLRP